MSIDVLSLLPHRYPMLLVDRIVEAVPGKRAVRANMTTVVRAT